MLLDQIRFCTHSDNWKRNRQSKHIKYILHRFSLRTRGTKDITSSFVVVLMIVSVLLLRLDCLTDTYVAFLHVHEKERNTS